MGDCGGPAFSDFGPQLFDVLIGNLNRADERFTFAHAVAIRTAGHQQIESVRNLKIMLGNRCGVLRVEAFDAVQSSSFPVQAGFSSGL